MRHSKRLVADTEGLAGYDVAQLAQNGLAAPRSQAGPIHGFVTRDGQTVAFTLDTSQPMPVPRKIVPEQIAMGALLLASFIGPIYHFLG